MPPRSPSLLEPVSSELQTIDVDRTQEVDRRHGLLSEYLSLRNLDGLLLTRPENFAWLSCGGDNIRRGGGVPSAAIFVTPDARLVLCNNADSGQIFDRELAGLGFQLKERPWTEDRHVLLNDLGRGRAIASDVDEVGLHRDLTEFRLALSAVEQDRLRLLGRDVAHAVEATCRQCERGETESEVAGQLAHRLLKRGITPIRLQVMADGQGRRYRHWSYGDDRIERYAVLGVVGRRHGLHIGCSRTVSFDLPPQDLTDSHQLAALVQATGIYFAQAGWKLGETFSRIARIYEKFGAADEWRAVEQGEVMGYSLCEQPVVPDSPKVFVEGSPVFWHPSVRSAFVGDTVLIHANGFEELTPCEQWPTLQVSVKGQVINRPAVLCRDEIDDGEWPADSVLS